MTLIKYSTVGTSEFEFKEILRKLRIPGYHLEELTGIKISRAI